MAAVEQHPRIWVVSVQQTLHTETHPVHLRGVEWRFAVARSKTRSEQQRVAFSQRHVEVDRQCHNQLGARS